MIEIATLTLFQIFRSLIDSLSAFDQHFVVAIICIFRRKEKSAVPEESDATEILEEYDGVSVIVL